MELSAGRSRLVSRERSVPGGTASFATLSIAGSSRSGADAGRPDSQRPVRDTGTPPRVSPQAREGPVRWPRVNWDEFEAAAPDLAATARELLVDADVALLGTLRREGAPRISCVQACILEGALYLGMMWRSRKAVDLARDPRLVLCNAICSNTGAEVELSLTGLAVAMTEPGLRHPPSGTCGPSRSGPRGTEPHFHLFTVDICGAALVAYAHSERLVHVWPQGVERGRSYS